LPPLLVILLFKVVNKLQVHLEQTIVRAFPNPQK